MSSNLEEVWRPRLVAKCFVTCAIYLEEKLNRNEIAGRQLVSWRGSVLQQLMERVMGVTWRGEARIICKLKWQLRVTLLEVPIRNMQEKAIIIRGLTTSLITYYYLLLVMRYHYFWIEKKNRQYRECHSSI